RALHDVNFDSWRFVDAGHLVVVEIGLLDAAAVDGDGVVQGCGEAVDGGAFHLGGDAGGIDGTAAVNGIHDAVNFNVAVFDADFGDACGVGLERIVAGDSAENSWRQRLVPFGFFRG